MCAYAKVTYCKKHKWEMGDPWTINKVKGNSLESCLILAGDNHYQWPIQATSWQEEIMVHLIPFLIHDPLSMKVIVKRLWVY